MSTTIVMPQLGESVAEGVIGKWLKNEGDTIERDEPIVEVITDKVNAEIPSPVAGVLEHIAQPEGATVAVGQTIASIGDSAGAARASVSELDVLAGSLSQRGNDSGGIAEQGAGVTLESGNTDSGSRAQRVRLSPLVRRLAEEHQVDVGLLRGTGVGGRVSKADILAFVQRRDGLAGDNDLPVLAPIVNASVDLSSGYTLPTSYAPEAPTPAPPSDLAGRADAPANGEIVRLSAIRKIIADRMALSKTTIPHATTIVEVDMTNVVRYREGKKEEFRRREAVPLSYVAFVIKATVESLKEYSNVNSEWGGDHFVRKTDININVAVDAPEGLTTPVIHHADRQSLTGLSKSIYDLALRARNKQLRIEDMRAGTFTVNNTGALGSVWSLSIINPPQCGMLAAAAIVKRPVVIERDGEDVIAVRSMMNLSFSFDHRILDGGYAAAFLAAIKDRLEKWPADYPLY